MPIGGVRLFVYLVDRYSSLKLPSMKTKSRVILTGVVALIFACESEPPLTTGDANFLTYSVSEQTSLATYISAAERKIKLEVDHDVDLTALVPDFKVDGNYTVLVNGVEQTPGVSKLDLTENVTYDLVNTATNERTEWTVMTTPLKCRIVIDASHDGGVWWFPQSPLQALIQRVLTRDRPLQRCYATKDSR